MEEIKTAGVSLFNYVNKATEGASDPDNYIILEDIYAAALEWFGSYFTAGDYHTISAEELQAKAPEVAQDLARIGLDITDLQD